VTQDPWRVWDRDSSVELRTYKRATGELPEMESTKQLVRLIAPVYQKGDRILDVGCAAGHYLNGLKRLDPEIRYQGVDATGSYIDFARKQFAHESHVSFTQGDIFRLSEAVEGTPDIVFCCNLLLHLPLVQVPIQNLVQVAKKHIFIRTLIADRTHQSKALITDDLDETGEPTNFTFQNTYSRDLIRKYVRTVGDYSVEFVDDEFEPENINTEYKDFTKLQGAVTRVVDGVQISGGKVFSWAWVVIKK
jgi:SAM-dependent methyltransferase